MLASTIIGAGSVWLIAYLGTNELPTLYFTYSPSPILVKGEMPDDELAKLALIWQNEALTGIKRFESYKPNAYTCPAGVKTIGFGCTKPEVVSRGTICIQEASGILMKEYAEANNFVNRIVQVPLTPAQRGALISFTFNCGPGNLKRLVNGPDRLNQGNYASVAKLLPKYNKGGGKVLRGLVSRRAWEVSMWNTDLPKATMLAANK